MKEEKEPVNKIIPNVDKKVFYTCTEATAKKLEIIHSKELPKKNHGDVSEEELSEIFNKASGKKMAKILKNSKGEKVQASHFVSFSVAKGVRVKYKPALTKDNKPFIIEGKMLLVDVSAKNASYEKNLKSIFKLFFGRDGSDSDLKKMNSFVGVLELLKSMNLPNKKEYYEQFLDQLIKEKLWGHPPYHYVRSQELERDSKEIDAEIKWSMVNYIMDELKVGNLNEIKKIANSYYDTWKGDASDDINEAFIPYGSKFSVIFEAVEQQSKGV